MPDARSKAQDPASGRTHRRGNKATVVDAIRHVGPTLEAEGVFLPTGELLENRIENEQLTDRPTLGEAPEDQYDREAEALGAEPLRTRLPGDTSSDPRTDNVADHPATTDSNRKPARKRRRVA
jgi:hypothetical protein